MSLQPFTFVCRPVQAASGGSIAHLGCPRVTGPVAYRPARKADEKVRQAEKAGVVVGRLRDQPA